jgi:hypothetical protein
MAYVNLHQAGSCELVFLAYESAQHNVQWTGEYAARSSIFFQPTKMKSMTFKSDCIRY